MDTYLIDWSKEKKHKPLLLRGARQVGKTFTIRQLGSSFESFIELNLETNQKARTLFQADLDAHRIVRDIQILTKKEIIPGKTLLFFDEIQAEPQAVLALRYFYEMIPELHVIAAGSLLDFALQAVGLPVGRVQTLYMYPLSFIEFLTALGEKFLIEAIMTHQPDRPISAIIHSKALTLLGDYLAVGGMPEVVSTWIETQNLNACYVVQQTLISSYKHDFVKYSTRFQIKYLDLLFENIPAQVGRKFKYSAVHGEYRKRELSPCIDLLITAGIITKVLRTDAQGLPLGAQANPDDFKLIFLDVALSQVVLGLEIGDWLLYRQQQFINKGEIIESFIGQELLAYANPIQKKSLYYWHRMERGSQAEVDYLISIQSDIVPIEVKSGAGSTLRSMHLFLDTHPNSTYGIRFSTQNYSMFEKIRSYPLYAIAPAIKFSIQDLLQEKK